ncbi:hypothetical protein [Bradyrhizobium guangdongense]|uniref:hypothetical protein n=1 Tax=Bradyrhizobium guangdongense TaxID=1325090 RepID=UPI00164323F7|nr:hypothetical protein [Bradyrhizobium guangdongense]
MGNRTAKFISALFASLLAGVPLSAVSQNAPSAPAASSSAPSAASAADDCLASPKKTAPEGQHWYYRIERGTKRQCWYLRAEGAKTVQSAQSTAPSQKDDAPTSRAVQDARAEWPTPQGTAAPDTTASIAAPTATASQPVVNPRASAPAGSADQSALSARWPDATAAAAPAAQPAAPATKTADTRPVPKPATAPAATAPVTLAAAEAPTADKPTGSLQTLLLVIGGALALAGILGSAVYRFSGSRVRVQPHDGTRRRINWDNWEAPADNARAPWAEAALAAAPRPQRPQPQPLDFSFALPERKRDVAPVAEVTDTHMLDEIHPAESDLLAMDKMETAVLARDEAQPEPETQPETDVETADAQTEPEETDADAVDIDIITEILERLAKEGPRLRTPDPEPVNLEPSLEPSFATGSEGFARSQPVQRAARA